MMFVGRLLRRLGIPINKVDIVHHVAARYGYRRYLEIATVTSGHCYADIDRRRFDDCRRLLYRCPPGFADGSEIDYRCPDIDISSALAVIAAEGRRFDIIFVDPFHTYDASLRDLTAAFALLDPGGAMVVHDCLPRDEAQTCPVYTPGDWSGVTYRAFLDFVLGRSDLRYLTVKIDYGCGVVRKVAPGRAGWLGRARERRRQRQISGWRRFAGNHGEAWPFFAAHRKPLLRLTGVAALFASRHGLG